MTRTMKNLRKIAEELGYRVVESTDPTLFVGYMIYAGEFTAQVFLNSAGRIAVYIDMEKIPATDYIKCLRRQAAKNGA